MLDSLSWTVKQLYKVFRQLVIILLYYNLSVIYLLTEIVFYVIKDLIEFWDKSV